ncbi:Fbox/LRR-repeat protein [Acanthamoeba castellanii str. Neff]|uniref:Fbox/LRR-repeat protein n=1 Tax=Acanthamoeba castellanii (strain ATCC 30010 / Neff) TaxID=1257118 RepID=L8GLX9_ACACF|nr:Fbox/LRR-repeat protein [Acanthamoeba castellanii str. Neff]ELR13211.1 Fbox/LRR-repeat protein [Acanthamoeba castellanii str. Neff]
MEQKDGEGAAAHEPQCGFPPEVWGHCFSLLEDVCSEWAQLAWRECRTLNLARYAEAITGSPSCFLFGEEGLLHRCKKVEELNLRKARIGNTQIERVLTYWPTLRRLNLSCIVRVNGVTLGLIGAHLGSRLTHLSLESCRKLRDSSFVEVLNIQGLDKLTDAGLAHLAANNTELRDLDMQSCSAEITRKAIKKLVRRASGLRRLILKFCRPVDDSVLRVIGDSLGPSLEVVEFQGCPSEQITDAGVIHLVSRCHRLQRLNLIGLRQLTDATLAAVAQHLEYVVELEMKECTGITDEGLRHLAQGANHRLCTFNFEFCHEITDVGIAELCALARSRKEKAGGSSYTPVRILNVGHLPRLTGRSLALIVQDIAADLHSLNLSDCALIDEESVLAVLRACSRLKVINLKGLPLLTDRVLEDILAHDCYALEKLQVGGHDNSFTRDCLDSFVRRKRPGVVLNVASLLALQHAAT